MRIDDFKARFAEMRRTEEMKFFGLPDFDVPVDVLMGLRQGMPSLVFMCSEEPPRLNSSLAVKVAVTKHGDIWQLLMIETEEKYSEPFCSFCMDILSVMEGAVDERNALSRLEARYEVWMSFWKSAPKMTEEKVRGLAGELLFLERCLDQGRNARQVVFGWHGASGADQDFVFDNAWAEVKTVRQSATDVKITSLEQLVNPASLEKATQVDGRLVIVRLHSDPAEGAFTLAQLHERILRRLEEDPGVQQKYLTELALTGADMESGNLETKLPLQLMEMKSYAVNVQGFPKLHRGAGIPEAVTNVSYSLSIAALKDWLIEGDDGDV